MSRRESVARLTASVSRLLALIDHHEIVRRFRNDWSMFDHTAMTFEDAVDRARETLTEVERDG